MKKTPLYDKHIEDGGKMVEFAGWDMPIQFSKVLEEHEHVRNHVGIFDVSHMGEVYIIGHEASSFLDNLLTNNINSMVKDQCLYTMMCYKNGTVVDDLLVYKFNDNKYLLVINAANDDKDIQWIMEQSKEFDVIVEHESHLIGEVAVQGPEAEALMIKVFGDIINSITFFTFKELLYDDISMIISRTGYTGEDGFEIFMPNGMLPKVYDDLFKVESNLKPIGLGARDTLRFEVALPLYGHEISDSINPVEARLSYFVDFDKDDFIGKDALLITKENQDRQSLVGFMLEGKGIAREHYSICNEDEIDIGHVTTGYKLNGYEGGIGLGLVPKSYSKLGSQIFIKIRNKVIPARVIKRKFYDKKYKK